MAANLWVQAGYVQEGWIQAGVTIDWINRIIFIPQAFLDFVGGSVYNLDSNKLRLELKRLEATPEGMVYIRTHQHNGIVLLGGIEYARTFEIINGYTVTIEDTGTPYVVNVLGSNNNILDVTNLNIVQIRSNNSAGLINVREIQQDIFGDVITLDQVNGTPGTLYPAGTPLQPVNNIADATTIANSRGLDTIKIRGNFTFGASDSVDNFIIIGDSPTRHFVSLTGSASITNCIFRQLTLSGILDGGNQASFCIIAGLNYIDGSLLDCLLVTGDIVLNGTQANFLRCASAIPDDNAVIDLGGTGTDLVIADYQGGITLKNYTSGNNNIVIDMSSGEVELDSTITAGNYKVRGIGSLVDNSTGTSSVDKTGLLEANDIKMNLEIIRKISTNRIHTNPNTGVLTIYDDDDVSIYLQANIYEDVFAAQLYRSQGIERRNRLT